MKQKLESIDQLEVGMLLYNYDFGNYRVEKLDKKKSSFEIVIIDNDPSDWYEIITQTNSKGDLNIFNGNWYIVDVEQ